MKRVFSIGVVVLCLFGASGCSSGDSPYDIIIMNATVYDGTSSDPYVGDIGIIGDRIAAVGDLESQTQNAGKIINAEGYIATPGFIDVHNHTDVAFIMSADEISELSVDPAFNGGYNYLYQGVTTIVSGNCGIGHPNIDEWFATLDEIDFGINVYHLIPYGAVRTYLFGEDEPEELSFFQLIRVKQWIAGQMANGALGLSTALEMYPDYLSNTAEMVEVVEAISSYGRILTTHMRTEKGINSAQTEMLVEHPAPSGANVAADQAVSVDPSTSVIYSIDEVFEIARRADVALHISHLKIFAPYNDLTANDVIQRIQNARAEGLDVTADQYPYDSEMSNINLLIPQKYISDTGVKNEYKDTAGRAEIKTEIEATFAYVGAENVLISSYPENSSYESMTIQEIADQEGREAADVYVDLVCSDQSPLAIIFRQSEVVVEGIMPNEFVFTASDGMTVIPSMMNPHPRFYGTFPRKIYVYVEGKGIMTLKSAIRSMTSLPAEKFKMDQRGKIAAGYYADIAVIDLDNFIDHATYSDPTEYATGVWYLLVNGAIAIEEGTATTNRGGQTLRKGS